MKSTPFLRAKYNDIEKANLAYRKQRKHTHKRCVPIVADVTENEKIGPETRADGIKHDEFNRENTGTSDG